MTARSSRGLRPLTPKSFMPTKPTTPRPIKCGCGRAAIRNGILKKEAHHIQLTVKDRENNHRKGLVRRQIERIFAHLKQWQHYRRVRYPGLARNQLELTLKAVAYNLKRLAGILEVRNG